MNIGKLVRERGDRIGFGSVRLAVFTAKVRCDSDNELWRFSRMPCALPLKPACGQKTFFITRIVCDCDHDLWRLFRIHTARQAPGSCISQSSNRKRREIAGIIAFEIAIWDFPAF